MESKRMRIAQCLTGGIISLLFAAACYGQAVSTVQISGVVQDPTGASIAGATVTAKQTQTGFTRSTASGSDGRYVIPQLPVGIYELVTEQKGFSTVVQKGIELQVGDNPRLDVTMQVGAVEQQVEVSGAAEMVQNLADFGFLSSRSEADRPTPLKWKAGDSVDHSRRWCRTIE